MENMNNSDQSGDEQFGLLVGRREQLGRLNREEAFYQFVNNLSEEDYRLMRDNNLFGTPGEITEEELLNRLQQVKDETNHDETRPEESDGPERQEDESSGDSILDFLNSVRQTGRTIRSAHRGGQSRRTLSRTNHSSRDFRFSLEINVNRNTAHQPVQTLEGGQLLGEDQEEAGQSAEPEGQMPERETPMEPSEVEEVAVVMVPEPEPLRPETPPVISPIRLEVQHLVPPSPFSMQLQRRGHRRARSRSPELRRTRARNERSRSPFHLDLVDVLPWAWHDSVRQPQVEGSSRTQQHVLSRQSGAEHEAPLGMAGPEPTSVLQEDAEDTRAAGHRDPTMRLDLRVPQVRPGEQRQRDSIANRTRSHSQAPSSATQHDRERGGLQRTLSQSEHSGIRTYISTIRIPIHRMAEVGLSDATSVALQTVIQQIMTGFTSLIDSDFRTLPDAVEVPSDLAAMAASATANSDRNLGSSESHAEETGQVGGLGTAADNREGQGGPQQPVGTLPFLRLAHFFLLNDHDEDQPRGLTKDQIDNLSMRSFGERDSMKTCSVCITEYAEGNKLRQLPCSHEYHVHCIDRWLLENSTCPICRRGVLVSSNQESVV